jgi:hypothetical protein
LPRYCRFVSRRLVSFRRLGVLAAVLLLLGCGSTGNAAESEVLATSLVGQPKSVERLKAGLEILTRYVELPKGTIEEFAQVTEHYWTPSDDAWDRNMFLSEPVTSVGPSLLAEVTRLAPTTGLWPVYSSEWEIPYSADMASEATSTPLETVRRRLERRNQWTSGANYPLPDRLAAAGSTLTKQKLGDYSFSLVQADSLTDLIRYVPTETFNSYDSTIHWISMVERFEMQVIAGEWHALAVFVHRPPATRKEAELLLLELSATGFDEVNGISSNTDNEASVDTLLEGGLLVFFYS